MCCFNILTRQPQDPWLENHASDRSWPDLIPDGKNFFKNSFVVVDKFSTQIGTGYSSFDFVYNNMPCNVINYLCNAKLFYE